MSNHLNQAFKLVEQYGSASTAIIAVNAGFNPEPKPEVWLCLLGLAVEELREDILDPTSPGPPAP